MKVFILLALVVSACLADKEYEGHGAGSPHEKRVKGSDHFKDGHHNAEYDHEAVIGSRKEAEEFDSLSPDESKKRLKVLAKSMDADGDGVVTKEELSKFIEQNLKQLDIEEVDERFTDVDTNHDGSISWEEYMVDAFGDDVADEEQGLNIDDEDKRLIEEDKRYFAAADVDGDKGLSKEEFAAFQNPEGFDHMFDSVAANTLQDKDKDGDGFISLNEFLSPHDESSDAEWLQSERSRFKNDYDKDGDGKLSREEMREWLIPNLSRTALEEAAHLISSADANSDEKLSIAEIVENYELFVGSEATNYGESLEKIKHTEL